MSDEPKEKEEGIFRLDTVPPPDGGTAYDAPTKVGPMPASVLDAMKKAALEGTALKPTSLPKPSKAPSFEELSDADVQSGDPPKAAPIETPIETSVEAPVETPTVTPVAPPVAPPVTPPPVQPPIAATSLPRGPTGTVRLPSGARDAEAVPKWAVVVIGVSLVVALVSVLALIFR